MTRLILAGLVLALAACGQPAERYGFLTRLGNDTMSIENVVRRGNALTIDGVDRFPRVRERHATVTLAPDGGIRRLVMDVVTPSEPANERERHIVADVTRDSVLMTKKDGTGSKRWAFAHGVEPVVAHVPQMYSLYELYLTAALERPVATTPAADTIRLRQFYIDREFDRFPLGHATVRRLPGNKAELWHDWLSGVGEATLDSSHRLLTYSGARTTYKVDVTRISEPADVQAIGKEFAALETTNGGVKQLSVRDTTRGSVGAATFAIDYGRPLARGRTLLGDVVPYDYVWRTGANAATQFTTSAPITLAGIAVPAGTYTLWTVPRKTGAADLIVNKQSGQWGTEYDGSRDLGMARMQTETVTAPVERFTISIVGVDDKRGTLVMEWGPLRWTAPIVVGSTQKKSAVKS
jgi:Protein of unknown function (DUF2911)